MPTPIFTIANQLTLLRMALAPVLVLLIVSREMTWAFAVFVIAGLTDVLDGLFARRVGQRTKLGAMLDPVADKLLLGSCYIALTWSADLFQSIPVWLTVVILSRDAIIVASVAIINLSLGHRIFYPSLLGKTSTAAQIVTAGLVLLVNSLNHTHSAIAYVFLFTAGVTVASALHYVYMASVRGPEAAS
jgi:cardiolipin synthase (CMP-forming)